MRVGRSTASFPEQDSTGLVIDSGPVCVQSIDPKLGWGGPGEVVIQGWSVGFLWDSGSYLKGLLRSWLEESLVHVETGTTGPNAILSRVGMPVALLGTEAHEAEWGWASSYSISGMGRFYVLTSK